MTAPSLDSTKTEYPPKVSLLDRIAKKIVLTGLSKLTIGHLVIEDKSAIGESNQTAEIYEFGQAKETAECSACICVENTTAYRDVFFNSSIGAGEAYMQGHWTTPNLLAVITLMVKNLEQVNKMDSERPLLNRLSAKFFHYLNANTRRKAKKNISAHYDLGNDFFSLFLDQSMMYSAAIYPNKNATLAEASTFKLDQICQKLNLSATDHLLEIGTGWGGMAIHAAKHYHCQVTTTTISQEQYQYAKQRVEAEGLADKVTVLMQDYRQLTGQYDKLVSIEMIEAVGHQFYKNYFSQCSHLLKPNGMMLIQAITIADQRYDYAKNSVDFIQRYIFPGGSLPSNEIITHHVARNTDMQLISIDDITEHYADTLADWRDAFINKLHQVKEQGFNDVFCRMWEYYLCYCEGGFRERAISTAHFTMVKPQFRFQPVLSR